MRFFAVIDTNVLVSALMSKTDDSATAQVLDRLVSGEVTLVYSDEIFHEYDDVLHRRRFGFPVKKVSVLLEFIKKYGEKLTPTPIGEILPDPKDLPFYEVVMEKGTDESWLVTGNLKHFPVKPFIVTPREFLDILDGNV